MPLLVLNWDCSSPEKEPACCGNLWRFMGRVVFLHLPPSARVCPLLFPKFHKAAEAEKDVGGGWTAAVRAPCPADGGAAGVPFGSARMRRVSFLCGLCWPTGPRALPRPAWACIPRTRRTAALREPGPLGPWCAGPQTSQGLTNDEKPESESTQETLPLAGGSREQMDGSPLLGALWLAEALTDLR